MSEPRFAFAVAPGCTQEDAERACEALADHADESHQVRAMGPGSNWIALLARLLTTIGPAALTILQDLAASGILVPAPAPEPEPHPSPAHST